MTRSGSTEIPFFDSNACLGRSVHRTPGAPYDRDGLLDEMDHCRISRALVFHAAAREQDPRPANLILIRECLAEPRLVPCAVLSPTPVIAGRDIHAEMEEYLDRGVRAFRMFPNYHAVDFASTVVADLLSSMQQRGLPLWLDFDQPYYNFSQLGQHEHRSPSFVIAERLAADYPGLPLVLCAANYNHNGRILEALGRFPNLMIETSLFQGLEMIARVSGLHGAQRLLFGSGLPQSAAGAARSALMFSGIGAEDKRRIAAGNLETLLGEKPTPTLPEDHSRSAIMLQADHGEPITVCPVHDCHGHIAPEGSDGIIGLSLGPQDRDSIIRALDRTGTRSLAVSSWQIYGGDAPEGNGLAWEAAEKYPGRILSYMVINPNYPEDWGQQVKYCFNERRFFGLKPYPFSQRMSITHRSFRPALELADKLRLPVLCHFGFEPLSGVTASQVEELAVRYPGAVFIVAHAGASYRAADQLVGPARRFDNVYLEINYTSVPCRMISYLASNAGVEKVLYGSDTPMRDPSPILGWVIYDRLDDRERAAILGGNLLELVRRVGYPGPLG